MESLNRRNPKHSHLLISLSILLLSLCSISCEKQETYSHFYEIKNGEWKQNDTLIFDIDSLSYELNTTYRLSVEVTNNTNYPYRNIWFFIQDNFRSDSVYTDYSKEYILADEFGKWNGSGFGNLFQSSYIIYDNLRLSERRNYRIKIEHGMRDEYLNGIEKVGINLSKHSN